MPLTRLAAAAALAGTALVAAPASANHDFCVRPESYMDICFPDDQPGCLLYGRLGDEGNFHVGNCERWHD